MKSHQPEPELHLRPDPSRCPHRYGYDSSAYAPAGVVCCQCDQLLLQYIPQPPEILGYLSADWAWHHRDGRPWTTQNA